MQLHAWVATDVGQTRKVNEDSYLIAPDLGLAAVADGMGGFQRGDVASGLACTVLKEVVSANRDLLDLYRRAPTEGTRQAISPVKPRGSRLVARIRSPAQPLSKASARSAQASMRCSQLSITSKVGSRPIESTKS